MNIVPRSEPFVEVVTELLSRGHAVRFRAEGGSMHPTIRAGEAITIEPVSRVEMGDIALYRAQRGLIAHRVVGIRKRNGQTPVFLTRGEAAGSTEEPVQEEHVLGKVRAVERNGRSIDLGGRWAKICGYVRILLTCALLAVVPSAARASIAVTSSGSTSPGSSNVCGPFSLDTSTGSPNVILLSASATNANTFNAPTISPAGGTVTLLFQNTTTATGEAAVWSITGFTPSTTTSFTVNMSGAAGAVCGAVAFSGVASVGTVANATGTSTSASVTVTSPGPGGVVFDTLGTAQTGGTGPTVTPGSGQVSQWNRTSANNRVGAASVAPPTNTMSWTLSTAQTWILVAVPLNPASATELRSSSLTVTRHANRNLIELKTGREVSSLGFNLYREQNGRRVRLNASLLAGTALLGGSERALTADHLDTAWDAPPKDASAVSYWLEEVDLHGQRTWYGPVPPRLTQAEAEAGRLGAVTTATVKEPEGRTMLLGRVGRESVGPHALQARVAPARTSPEHARTQFALAAGQAVKLSVQSEGWYRVVLPDLVAAGFNPNADASTLQLFAEGVEQPLLVQGQTGGKLGPRGNIQFYGTGLDTTWSDTRVYWLTWGNGAGQRVQTETLQRNAPAGPSNFISTLEWKPRTVYFAALLNGDADNFFGPVLTSGEPVGQAIDIMHLDPSAAQGGQLRVALQGVSLAPHSVAVTLNGSQVGTVTFSNQTEGVATLTVPEAMLQEGQNLLTLTVAGGADDVSVVDNVELSYPRTYTADNDSLRFTAPGGQAETIGGFTTPQIVVVDISDPAEVTVVRGTIAAQAGRYSVTVVPQGTGSRTLLALTSAEDAKPASITPHHPSSWHAAQTGFDMVMISHADFVQALGPLVTLHQAQGLTPTIIDVEDLYDEFNFGEKSPYALKDFLSTAKAQWQLKPRFVLLTGDATYDPRNYLGVGNFDFVPTYLVETTMLETASDDWFADFTGQGLPQMAIGRLPVRTEQDATALVNKIVTYEQSGAASWKQQVLLVAGQNDSENDFDGDAAAVQALLPVGLTVSEITAQDPGANLNLLNLLNTQGAAIVNYIGHGSESTWAGGLLDSTGVESLTNGSMVPFVVSMTCLNGYFQDVFGTALAKALIGAPGGGALAVWASSGLTDSGSQSAMNRRLITALFGTSSPTLGEAAAFAKTAVADLDVRRTWILFGDPAVRLQK